MTTLKTVPPDLPPSLVRFESELHSAIRRHRCQRPRRIAFRASAACAAAAIGLGVFTFWPSKDSPASAIEQAKAVLTQTDGGIQHVVESTDLTRPDGERETMGSETWSLTTPPHDERQIEFRNGEVRFEGGSADGRPEFYDPQTNTVSVLPDGVEVPEELASAQPTELRTRIVEGMLRLLNSGEAHETGRETVDGREAIRIVSDVESMTLLVDAETFEPIEWTGTADDGTETVTRIRRFETLPATPENLALLSVRGQHPDATVVQDVSIVVEPGGNVQVYDGEPVPDGSK